MAQFDLQLNESITLDVSGVAGHFQTTEHPNAPGMALVMEGAKGKVFSLRARNGDRYALKLMKNKHRLPELAQGCTDVGKFKAFPGLTVCNRYCLTTSTSPRAVQKFPALEFSILMPWIAGRSWFDVVAGKIKQALPPSEARAICTSFISSVAMLESVGAAHCDLSAGNIIIGSNFQNIELIDVEDMFAPGFARPKFVSTGTAGYQHHESSGGQWSALADRFAAAVLVAEMLGWADPQVVSLANGESYFDPAEMQDVSTRRYRHLLDYLKRMEGAVVPLFERAWMSTTLAECPSLSDWHAALLGKTTTVSWQSLGSSRAAPSSSQPAVEWTGLALPTAASGMAGSHGWQPFNPAGAASPPVVTWDAAPRPPKSDQPLDQSVTWDGQSSALETSARSAAPALCIWDQDPASQGTK